MVKFELTNIKLFEVVTEIIYNDQIIDIHNNYECFNIETYKNDLIFKFLTINNMETFSHIDLVFNNYLIIEQKNGIDNINIAKTLANFQRCKSLENGVLIELDSNGYKSYILEFEEGQSIELKSKNVHLLLYDKSGPQVYRNL